MNIFKKLWDSPTFTQYGKYFSTLGGVVFLLPIVLTNFQPKDIAIWLLISTVTLFSTILSQRLQITFMRIVSFAFIGAKDYNPILAHGEKRGDGKPNWRGIKDIFVTLSKTFFLVSFFTTVIVILSLLFGINNLVDSFEINYILIIIIISSSTLFTQNFIKYKIFLMGFNEVALVNRWNALFSLLGIVGAILILKLGGGLIELVSWQLFVPIISALRDKSMFNSFLTAQKQNIIGKFDKSILYSVKEPLWKGFVSHSSQMGMVQLSGVIFTIYGDTEIVASYLFSLKILMTLANFSQVPFSSQHPYFSKLRAEGKIGQLSSLFKSRIFFSLLTYSVGVVVILLLNEYLLNVIDSNISFVNNETWILMGLLYGIERLNIFYQAILASANHVILYIEQVISALITLFLLFIFVETYGVVGIILSLFLPRIILFNIRALKYAANSLNQNILNFYILTFSPLLILITIYLKGILFD